MDEELENGHGRVDGDFDQRVFISCSFMALVVRLDISAVRLLMPIVRGGHR
jgi:hypothetical protein